MRLINKIDEFKDFHVFLRAVAMELENREEDETDDNEANLEEDEIVFTTKDVDKVVKLAEKRAKTTDKKKRLEITQKIKEIRSKLE